MRYLLIGIWMVLRELLIIPAMLIREILAVNIPKLGTKSKHKKDLKSFDPDGDNSTNRLIKIGLKLFLVEFVITGIICVCFCYQLLILPCLLGGLFLFIGGIIKMTILCEVDCRENPFEDYEIHKKRCKLIECGKIQEITK